MSMTRRQWIGATAGSAIAQSRRPPNVLLIMSDDQGYGDLSIHGNPYLKTPHLDSIARDGAQFTRFCVSPVCAPTRSSLLTGRYNLRCGVWGVTQGRETMRTEEVTLAEAFRSAGYRTGLMGKWHLGEHYPYVPHAQGFDEFIGFRTGHWMEYFDSPLERNGKPIATSGYIADVFTDNAIRFLDQSRRDPFFLYVAYNTPHSPFQVPDRYLKPFENSDLAQETKAVYAMVSNLDENVGRLLSHLDRSGLADNTIVIFLTDNGPNGRRFTGGLRGQKGAVYEGGVRAPFFIRWPRRFKPGTRINTLAAHIDVLPTLLDFCGVKRPDGPPIDGQSLRPLLETSTANWPDRILFTHREGRDDYANPYPGTARTQRFNLVNGKELYDLSSDPGEQHNVAGEHSDQVRRLRDAYESWYRVAAEQCGYRRPPIPIGYREENPVSLPAPQAYFDGGVKYFGGPGFAHDWLTGWTNPDDSIYWEIDIAHSGRYEVSLSYLAPQDDVGAKVAVEVAGRQVSATIDKPTPMEPKPTRDYVRRSETAPMHWGRLDLGELSIERGRSRLIVKAVNKTGNAVMDLQRVILRRLA